MGSLLPCILDKTHAITRLSADKCMVAYELTNAYEMTSDMPNTSKKNQRLWQNIRKDEKCILSRIRILVRNFKSRL